MKLNLIKSNIKIYIKTMYLQKGFNITGIYNE